MSCKILVVDDDPTQRRLLELAVEDLGFEVETADSGWAALEVLDSTAAVDINLVLLDIMLPDIDGIDILEKICPRRPSLPFVMLTAHGSINLVVRSMRAGAIDFVTKPASLERLKSAIEGALEVNAHTDHASRRRLAGNEADFGDILGNSEAIRTAKDLARRSAGSDVPILIEGQSGVGKELFARAVQSASDRRKAPFVTVNCGAIPDNLVESILFGHARGAFTGAIDRHPGKFQEADGGTLFLDEIGELKPGVQVKLLRVLQEGEIDPVGGSEHIKVDIRLVSATNRSLEKMVGAGEFREDLFYRLNVFPIRIPALRERPEDIPEIASGLLRRIAKSEGRKITGIAPDAMEILTAFSWPGNVRQLENAIFRAVVLGEKEALTIGDFPQIVNLMGTESVARDSAMPGAAEAATVAGPGSRIPLIGPEGHLRQIRDIEADVIALAMDRYKGRMSEIARRLGIGRSTLYRKLADMGIGPDHAT